jgi:hypothetical protein
VVHQREVGFVVIVSEVVFSVHSKTIVVNPQIIISKMEGTW